MLWKRDSRRLRRMGSILTRSKDKNNTMPRSKRNTPKSPAPVVKEEAPSTRRTRGAAAPTVETPSPKKTRKRSPSPSPAPRGRSKGRNTKEPETKKQKGQGDDAEEPSPKKGRVTRAVVQQEEAPPSRGRASSRKAAEPKKPEPSPTPKSRSSSRQKAVPTPTKAEKPKAETSRSRSRSKPEPKTPEPKPAKAKSTPKSETKKTPVKKAASSPKKTPAKSKPSPKPSASRSRSRGKKDEKTSDLPSAQIILTKIDSPTKANTSLAENEEETISSSRSRGRSSAKTSPSKVSPKASRRSKSSEKSTPPTRRGRRSAEAEEEVEDEAKEMESEEKDEETKDEECKPPTEQTEKTDDVEKAEEDMDAAAEEEEKEKESDDVKEEENAVKEEENKEEEDGKDEKEEESNEKEEENEEAKMEESEVTKVPDADDKQEEEAEEEMEEETSKEQAKPSEPEQEPAALEPSPPQEPSPAPAAEECKPPEIEAISDDDDVEEEKEEPMEEDGDEEQKDEEEVPKDKVATPAIVEPVAAQEEMVQEIPEPTITDGEHQNGSPDNPLSSPNRKRKWDDMDDEGEELSPKKVRRSIDMTDVTSEGVVTTNGEDQMSKPEIEEESMETGQKDVEPEQQQTSSDSASGNIEQEYVVVNMDEIPAANSTEVLQSLPTESSPKKEEAAPASAAEQSQSITPPAENQEQTTAAVISPSSEFNPVLSRKYIPNPSYNSTADSNKQFSVVSYNILAQCHLERNDYSFTESRYLEENYRHQNLMKEIEYLNADLVCMQEVGPSYYESLLKPAMTKLGYEGLMKKRTEEYFNEGEATFYRTSRFSVEGTWTYSLKDLAEQELEDGGVSEEVKKSIRSYLNLPDVLVLTKLRCNLTGSLLCMGNIHVQWGKMEIPDAQCIQIVCAIKELAKQGGSDCHAQILCGDFNSEVTSPGYQLATDGYITDEVLRQLQALENLEMADSSKAALVNHLWSAFQHTSELKSAYQSAQGCEPVVTSYNRVMLAAVDYIFYCGSNLNNVGVLQTASEQHIKATGGIPDQFFPSDHVSMKAVFAFS